MNKEKTMVLQFPTAINGPDKDVELALSASGATLYRGHKHAELLGTLKQKNQKSVRTHAGKLHSKPMSRLHRILRNGPNRFSRTNELKQNTCSQTSKTSGTCRTNRTSETSRTSRTIAEREEPDGTRRTSETRRTQSQNQWPQLVEPR